MPNRYYGNVNPNYGEDKKMGEKGMKNDDGREKGEQAKLNNPNSAKVVVDPNEGVSGLGRQPGAED